MTKAKQLVLLATIVLIAFNHTTAQAVSLFYGRDSTTVANIIPECHQLGVGTGVSLGANTITISTVKAS